MAYELNAQLINLGGKHGPFLPNPAYVFGPLKIVVIICLQVCKSRNDDDAECVLLGIPFCATVTGLSGDFWLLLKPYQVSTILLISVEFVTEKPTLSTFKLVSPSIMIGKLALHPL